MLDDTRLALTARQHALLLVLAAHTVLGHALRSPLRGVADDAEWRQQAELAVRRAWEDTAVTSALRRWLAQPHVDLASSFDQQLSRLRRVLRTASGRDWIDERGPGAVGNRRRYRLTLPASSVRWVAPAKRYDGSSPPDFDRSERSFVHADSPSAT